MKRYRYTCMCKRCGVYLLCYVYWVQCWRIHTSSGQDNLKSGTDFKWLNYYYYLKYHFIFHRKNYIMFPLLYTITDRSLLNDGGGGGTWKEKSMCRKSKRNHLKVCSSERQKQKVCSWSARERAVRTHVMEAKDRERTTSKAEKPESYYTYW